MASSLWQILCHFQFTMAAGNSGKRGRPIADTLGLGASLNSHFGVPALPTVKDMTSFLNLWGHIFVDPHVIRWWDPTNANTNLWQDLGLGWQGLWMPLDADLLGPNFCETCTTLDQASLLSRPTAASERQTPFLQISGGIFSVTVGSLCRFFILWIPFLWAPGSFMQISGSGSWSWHFFSCIFRRSKVQSVSSHHTSMCKRLPCWWMPASQMVHDVLTVSTCLPRSITACYIMLHPAISPAILEFPVIDSNCSYAFSMFRNFTACGISGEQHCDSRELRNDLGCDCVRRPKLSSTWVPSLVLRNNAMIESLPSRLKRLQTFARHFPSEFLASHQFPISMPGNRLGTTVWPGAISKARHSQNVREVISKDLQDVLIQFIMSHSLRYGWWQCWFKWGDTKSHGFSTEIISQEFLLESLILTDTQYII